MTTIAACLLWAWAARVASLVAGVALGMVTVPITRLTTPPPCVSCWAVNKGFPWYWEDFLSNPNHIGTTRGNAVATGRSRDCRALDGS